MSPEAANAFDPTFDGGEGSAGDTAHLLAAIDEVAMCGPTAIPLLLLVDRSTMYLGRNRQLPPPTQRAIDSIIRMGAAAIPILVRELGDPEVGYSAERVLAHVGREAVPTIESALIEARTGGWWADERARASGCFKAICLLEKFSITGRRACEILMRFVFDDTLESVAGRAASFLDALVESGRLDRIQLDELLLQELSRLGDYLPRLIASGSDSERLAWAQQAWKRIGSVTWQHRLTLAARKGVLRGLSSFVDQLLTNLHIPDRVKPTCWVQTQGPMPEYWRAQCHLRVAAKVLLQCEDLSEEVLQKMDEAFVRERTPYYRLSACRHPSASPAVWLTALQRAPDPALIECISAMPEATCNPDIAVFLTTSNRPGGADLSSRPTASS